jgi:hypothetical protein
MTQPGTVGFAWHEVEIEKIGTTVTWAMDGTTLITLETEHFTVPTSGTNILFGHADINASLSFEPNYQEVAFTLIDNITVETIEAAPTVNPDFNGDQMVDAADYVVWRDNAGKMGTGTQATGDANGDMNVNQADYDLWRAAFGTTIPGGLGAAVPEPSSVGICVTGVIVILGASRRRS